MANLDLSLQSDDARLVYLAVAYHLGRPGSELDPTTKMPVERGLADTARELQPQLRMAVATITLEPDQRTRLQSAMLGTITELKAFSMLEPRVMDDGTTRRSTVPGFDRTLLHLFPELEEEPAAALDVAEQMLMLKRRFDQQVAALPPDPEPEKPAKKGWRPFGR
ncbi:MAG: hypothetical protein AB7T32_10695 [Dehalococcoidia bacterium]